MVDEYFVNYFYNYIDKNPSDVSNNLNSNTNENKSFNNFTNQLFSPVLKDLGRKVHFDIMKNEYGIKDASDFWNYFIDNGYLYFHDQDKMFIPYCFAPSTSILALEGRSYGQLHSLPAKRSDSFIAQVIEYVMDLSQEFAGAVAPSDIFVEYAKFTLREQKNKKDIENDLQKFVHVINNKFRVGSESVHGSSIIKIYDDKIKNWFDIRINEFEKYLKKIDIFVIILIMKKTLTN